MFKIDMHVHTSESSLCGKSTAEEMVKAYKAKGYDAIAITDHFVNGSTRVPKDLPWEERIHLLFEGYRRAEECGKKIGIKVFQGFEYPDKGSDFLVYGITEEFLCSHPETEKMDIVKLLALFRENGGFVIHAHPIRNKNNGIHLYPRSVDAIEVYNGGHGLKYGKYDPKDNDLAKFYADQTDLPQTGASDTHDVNHMYGGGMVFEREPNDIHDLIDMIRSKNFAITED